MAFNLKKLDMVKLPQKVTPCPIVNATVELRFESSCPEDAIIGIVYKEFENDYKGGMKELPILQIPGEIRREDKNLKHHPHYVLLSPDEKYLFGVGPRVISLTRNEPYEGWGSFRDKLEAIVGRVKKLKIVKGYQRVGIRYVDGFDINILDEVNLDFSIAEENFKDKKTNIKSNVSLGKYTSTIRLNNDVKVSRGGEEFMGSWLDIDTYQDSPSPSDDVLNLIEEGHDIEKKLFFTMLKDSFVKSKLNPEY